MNLIANLNKIKWATFIGGFLYLPWYWIMPILYPGTWNPLEPRLLISILLWSLCLYISKKTQVDKFAEIVFDLLLYVIVVHHFVLTYFNTDEIVYRYTFFMVTIMAGAMVHSFTSYLLVVIIALGCKLFLTFHISADIKFEIFEFGLWLIQLVIIGIIIRANFKSRDEIHVMSAAAAENAKVIALGTMSGGVAHEINNPLTTIKLTSELLKLKAAKDQELLLSDCKEEMERILFNVDRITKIVTSLQTMTKNSSTEPLSSERLDVVIAEFSQLVSSSIIENSIQMKISNVPKVKVKIRKNELIRALDNIIENSITALRNSKTKQITISFLLEPGLVKINIQDTGPGVPENIRNRTMDPFFTTKEVGQGYGLGLSLARAVVESFQGHLACLPSVSGAHFQIQLPIERVTHRVS
jgi:signal transduction histidine kinase